jgi:ABC-type spermidine/putrescine transport system permease subunit II
MKATAYRDTGWIWKLGRAGVLGLSGLVLVFNLGVLVVVFLTSLSNTDFLVFPPRGFTLHWYTGLADSYADPITYSLQVSILAASAASLLGTLASLSLARSNIRFKSGILIFLLSPLIIPSTIFGLAALVALTQIGLHPGVVPLGIVLTVFTTPFCVRLISSGLQNIDWTMEAAARTLGASRLRALVRVIMPLAAPSVAAGWIITFILAFDDSSISIFLARPTHQTYGAQILFDLSNQETPAIAAAGSAVIAITLVGALVLALVYWLQRRFLRIGVINPIEISTPVTSVPESARAGV